MVIAHAIVEFIIIILLVYRPRRHNNAASVLPCARIQLCVELHVSVDRVINFCITIGEILTSYICKLSFNYKYKSIWSFLVIEIYQDLPPTKHVQNTENISGST